MCDALSIHYGAVVENFMAKATEFGIQTIRITPYSISETDYRNALNEIEEAECKTIVSIVDKRQVSHLLPQA